MSSLDGWNIKAIHEFKKRIVFLAPQILSTDHGGGIRVIEEARSLSIYGGNAISIFAYGAGRKFDDLLPSSVSIHRILYTPKTMTAGPTLHRIHMDVQLALKLFLSMKVTPSIVHVHAHEGVPTGKIISLLRGCPLVFDMQGSTVDEMASGDLIKRDGFFYRLMCHIERMIDEMPSVIINSSPLVTKMMINDFSIDKRRVFTVLDAVDTNVVKPMSHKNNILQILKRRLGIPKDNIVVIYVGSFSKLQGTDILIKSISHVVNRVPNVTFLLIGGKWNSKYYKSIMKSAQDLNVKEHALFIPSVDYFIELPNYLNLADVAVAPKKQSLQSHGKLAAYMAAGLPTVVFDIPINRVFLGELGVYQRNVSPESLADSIVFAIKRYINDPVFKHKLRLRANNLFSLKRLANDLDEVYTKASLAC